MGQFEDEIVLQKGRLRRGVWDVRFCGIVVGEKWLWGGQLWERGDRDKKCLAGCGVCVCVADWQFAFEEVETEMSGIKGRKELMNTKTTKRVWKRRRRLQINILKI
jgi:hypothetical protein